MALLVEAHIVSGLPEEEYFNFSVRMHASYSVSFKSWLSICCPHYQSQVLAVTEWGAEGEWAVESVTQAIDELATLDSESSVIAVVLHEHTWCAIITVPCLIACRQANRMLRRL